MIEIYKNYDISNLSIIKVGGIVKRFIRTDEVNSLVKYYSKDVLVIGNTSKILFAFDYFNHDVLKFTNNKAYIFKDKIICYSGITLAELYSLSLEHEFDGFSSLSTIPGQLGGSVVNNASFLKQSISDLIEYVIVLTPESKFEKKLKDELLFSYRNSYFKKVKCFILLVCFKRVFKSRVNLENEKEKATKYRKENQPTGILTLGSTFKNNDHIPVGKILDFYSAKSYSEKGVKVSIKHANFLQVEPHTSYVNILRLIERLCILLYNKTGFNFDLEIIIVF